MAGSSRRPGDVVLELVERVADGELRRDLRDRVARRLRGERARSRDAWIHLDHVEAAVLGAHGRDERLGVKQFYEGIEFLYRLVKALSS